MTGFVKKSILSLSNGKGRSRGRGTVSGTVQSCILRNISSVRNSTIDTALTRMLTGSRVTAYVDDFVHDRYIFYAQGLLCTIVLAFHN